MSLVPPGRTARPEAVSSVAPRLNSLGAPCVLASERPSHPGDEAHYVGASQSHLLFDGGAAWMVVSFPGGSPSIDATLAVQTR